MIYDKKKNYPDIMSKHRWDLVGHYANFGRPMSKDRLLFAGGRNLLDNTQMSRGLINCFFLFDLFNIKPYIVPENILPFHVEDFPLSFN